MADYLARLTLGSGARRCVACGKVVTGGVIQVSTTECREYVIHPECAETYQRLTSGAEHAAIASASEEVSRG